MRKSAQTGEVSYLKSAARDFPGGPVVRTSPSNEGLQVRFPGQGVKIPHVYGQNTNTENRNYIVRNSIKTFQMVHIKKKL